MAGERSRVWVAPTSITDLPALTVGQLLAFSGKDERDRPSRLIWPFRHVLIESGTHPRHWPDYEGQLRDRQRSFYSGELSFTGFIQNLDTEGNPIGDPMIAGMAVLHPPKEKAFRRSRRWNELVLGDYVYPFVDKIRQNIWTNSDGTNMEFLKIFKDEMMRVKDTFDLHGYYHLKLLFIHPDFQRKGVGSALVRHCFDLAESDGLPLSLEASVNGCPLYTSLGFRIIYTSVVNYKGERVSWEVMMKEPLVKSQVDAEPSDVSSSKDNGTDEHA